MFLRTGLLPRVAKKLLTSREERELRAFDARFPISDEANFQIPQARMYASYLNAHRKENAPAADLRDFVLGYAYEREDEELDEEFLEGRDW